MEKLNMEQFKAFEIPQNQGTIYKTYDSKELKIERLAEKINEIIEVLTKE